MKRICIVTLYNSINSGSYWQAKAFEMYLKSKGYDIFFLARNDLLASSHFITKSLKVLKRILLCKFKDAYRFYKMHSEFSKLQRRFRIINYRSVKNFDCIILGSDTIWDLNREYFARNRKRYFGGIFDMEKVISYAPSSANTSFETFKKYTDVANMINNLSAISVRDMETYEIVKRITEKEITLVCDPTLLIEKDTYKKMNDLPIKKERYVFLYLFKSLTENQIIKLKEFSSQNNLKLVSGARYLEFADENVINAPNLFLNHMLYADYIITDTFHGTLFSINLNKQFITINRNKKKVNDTISFFHLDNRLIDDNDLVTAFENKIDYNDVNQLIETFRDESCKYLDLAINSKKGE